MTDRYRTPEAFRAALDARLRREAKETGRPLNRIIQLHLMHRFLARVLDEFKDGVTIKGGMALELRLDRARTTKDIDMRMDVGRNDVFERLRRMGPSGFAADRLTFTVDENPDDADIDGDGVVYEGFRFRAQAHFAGKAYGAAFGVDVAFGDPMTGTREYLPVPNLLDIVDAPPLSIPLYPVATHLAEKLHAYTLPRERLNHRLKDLVDIALIAAELAIDAATLGKALDETFAFRGSHPLPATLPLPPAQWADRYPKERRDQNLSWPTIESVHAAASQFLDPVLAGAAGTWTPESQAWA